MVYLAEEYTHPPPPIDDVKADQGITTAYGQQNSLEYECCDHQSACKVIMATLPNVFHWRRPRPAVDTKRLLMMMVISDPVVWYVWHK